MMHSLTDALINAEVLLDKDDSAVWLELFAEQLPQMAKSLVNGIQTQSLTLWSTSVNLTMGRLKNIRPM